MKEAAGWLGARGDGVPFRLKRRPDCCLQRRGAHSERLLTPTSIRGDYVSYPRRKQWAECLRSHLKRGLLRLARLQQHGPLHVVRRRQEGIEGDPVCVPFLFTNNIKKNKTIKRSADHTMAKSPPPETLLDAFLKKRLREPWHCRLQSAFGVFHQWSGWPQRTLPQQTQWHVLSACSLKKKDRRHLVPLSKTRPPSRMCR